MKKSVLAGAVASAAVALAMAASSSAQASTVFNASLASPGVYYGAGNNYTPENFAVTTADGVEIALRSHIRGVRAPSSTGDNYSFALGNKINFDYSVNPNVGGSPVDLSGVTALLTILNEGNGSTFSFDPSLVHDNFTNAGAPGGYQNSEQLAFFPVDFRPDANFTYLVTLSLSGVPAGSGTTDLSVDNVVTMGSGTAVPEPASWALMIVGFAGIGAGLRRSRKASTLAAA